MNIANYTPHIVRLNDGREFPSVGVARVSCKHTCDYWLLEGADGPVTMDDEALTEGIPLYDVAYGKVEGLPAPEKGTYLIVSGVVKAALPDRRDLLVPTTGHPRAVRKDGQVWSVPGFTR